MGNGDSVSFVKRDFIRFHRRLNFFDFKIILLGIFQTEGIVMDRLLSDASEFVDVLNVISPNAIVFFALATVFLALIVLLIKL